MHLRTRASPTYMYITQGNPLALVPKYRQYVLHWLPGLQTLDDLPVSPEERNQGGPPSANAGLPLCGEDLHFKVSPA